MKADLSPSGLAINVDVGQVDPAFSGQLSLHYKTTIPESVLTAIPRRSLTFGVHASGFCVPSAFPLPRPA
ncbi:hypothetical protein [Mycobacterium seoulense]|uniref:Uncharacterized protein n=1 Tax=Mycobacterium seoulense TaxID=386911 RepID=A0A7I7NXP0_9MYCO|nr:hypothetical protein [Mycobacterium seoulense]BBY00954.1 hypothetical protein MSEO_14530 [Mycobacterium seoulense]